MKKTIITFAALSVIFLTGCENDPITYSGPDFVSFSEASINKTVRENEDGIVSIPIGVSRKSSQDRTFSVSVDADHTTALEGTHFNFVAKSVTIPAGEYTGKVKIKGNYENLSPEPVALTLKLDTEADMLQEGGTITSVTINLSRFFEFNMEWLIGNWAAQDTKNGENSGDPYGMIIEQVNGDTVSISGLWDTPSSIKGIVDWDNSQISIPSQQYVFTHSTLGAIYIFNVIGSSLSNAPIVCDVNYKGITTGSYGLLNTAYSGWFPYVTVMTKDE